MTQSASSPQPDSALLFAESTVAIGFGLLSDDSPDLHIPDLETASAKSVTGAKPVEVTPKPTPKAEPAPKAETDKLKSAIDEKGGMLFFFIWAFGMGLITLLTPCVLPVLPLTIAFFVKQAEQKRPPLITAGDRKSVV